MCVCVAQVARYVWNKADFDAVDPGTTDYLMGEFLLFSFRPRIDRRLSSNHLVSLSSFHLDLTKPPYLTHKLSGWCLQCLPRLCSLSYSPSRLDSNSIHTCSALIKVESFRNVKEKNVKMNVLMHSVVLMM